ncbi:MAG: hypothetical protein DRJ42_20865 [Deltaproteobacteria bacterium]|nr:MAG: hypothetical protein DRJ42_20865 [Deltaproteobacteria bacterium]
MKKQQRRQRVKRSRKNNQRNQKGGPISARGVATEYLKSRPDAPGTLGRALRAAMPRDVPLYTSHWLAAGAARGRKASGLGAFQMITLLGDFLEWCYERGVVPQHDAAVCIAQLELLRRSEGAEPGTVTLPKPRGPGELNAEELRGLVASWEAMSYGAAVFKTSDDRAVQALLGGGIMTLTTHLAATDGVPMRLDRLDPATFALELDAQEPSDELGPAPDGYVSFVLEGASLFYERCAERGYVDEDLAAKLSAQLAGLAMAYYQGERAA